MGAHTSKKRQREKLGKNMEKNVNSIEEKINGIEDVLPVRDPAKDRPQLTERQRQLILETWKIIQEDIAKVGVIMFMNLFETHPDVKEVFMPFKGMTKEDLQHSSALRAHALRVMGLVEKALARIYEPDKLIALLHELGRNHVTYNAKVDYIDLVGPQFLFAVEPCLAGRWTPEVEQAWSDLFKFIGHVMKEAMLI